MLQKYFILASIGTIAPIAIKHVPDTPALIGSLISIFLGTLIVSVFLSRLFRGGIDFNLRNLIEIFLWLLFSIFALQWIPQIWYSSKEVFIALCIAYLIFLFLERIVNLMSYAFSSALELPTELIAKICKKLVTKKFKKILPQVSILNRLLDVPRKLNEDDRRTTSIHEAGHALVYGILEQIPESLFIEIRNQYYDGDYISSSGFCGSAIKEQAYPYQSFVEFRMLVTLGGFEAEKAILGECSTGARSDIKNWYLSARLYHSCGFSGKLYFPDPEADWEEKANREVLETLLQNHHATLAQFFQVNLTVLKELADALLEQNKMKASDLAPYLERVVRTHGMPVVLKEYSPQI
jgi:Peptidase family M41